MLISLGLILGSRSDPFPGTLNHVMLMFTWEKMRNELLVVLVCMSLYVDTRCAKYM